MPSTPDPAASPCINVCKINDRGICEGCYRTLDEIAIYARLSDADRSRVNQDAKARQRSRAD